ncbi:hypothetical protein BGW80DRAFT_1563652 [Lactifluus volemus]|nr:hypothetical protein BGW80DRAFT_1563652 [Lactifluus volemus]
MRFSNFVFSIALAAVVSAGVVDRRATFTGKRDVELRENVVAPPACAKTTRRDFTPTQSNLLKRIAQTDLTAVAQSWQNLCVVSGGPRSPGPDPCVQLAGQNGIASLLANANACAQQDNADAMIDFAKKPGVTNKQALIANAITYRKHPRNALNIGGIVPSTPFCERAARNPELKGVVNAQLKGVDPGLYGGPNSPIVPFGANGTCPFGQTPNVATCTCH